MEYVFGPHTAVLKNGSNKQTLIKNRQNNASVAEKAKNLKLAIISYHPLLQCILYIYRDLFLICLNVRGFGF